MCQSPEIDWKSLPIEREAKIYGSVSSNYIVVLQSKAAKQDVRLSLYQGGINLTRDAVCVVCPAWVSAVWVTSVKISWHR